MWRLLLVAAMLFVAPAEAGKYRFSHFDGSNSTLMFPSFAIMHPIGYTGAGGPLSVKVCAPVGSGTLRPALKRAIESWNDRTSSTANCTGCMTLEQVMREGAEDSAIPLQWVIAHELGHCAYGTDHPNEGGIRGSFTYARRATTYRACTLPSPPAPCPPEAIRGDFDDAILPQPPAPKSAIIINWFEAGVNNPFVIAPDTKVLTRVRTQLPLAQNHSWPANPNRLVAASLGFPNAQSPMYSSFTGGSQYSAFVDDDVATVRNAEIGLDRLAGTADDYSVTLDFVDGCGEADTRVEWLPDIEDSPVEDLLGVCDSDALAIPGQAGTAQHYSLSPFSSIGQIRVALNSDEQWQEFELAFEDGFESGSLDNWSSVEP
ncbi:MAG: hypothetical protein AAF772_12040 [Acidobacteriota bacterium]